MSDYSLQRRIRLFRIACVLSAAAAVLETLAFAANLATGNLLRTILSAVAAAGFAGSACLYAVTIRRLRREVQS
jgi:hypothetical protein